MRNINFTLVGLAISAIMILVTLIFEAEFFEIFMGYMHNLENLEIDELIIPFFIVSLCALLDVIKWREAHKIEKIKIYRAMVSSMHHVLNNFLQKMELFKMKAERSANFDPENMKLYNEITQDAMDQIHALGNIAKLDEESIHRSVDANSNGKVSTQQDVEADADKLYR